MILVMELETAPVYLHYQFVPMYSGTPQLLEGILMSSKRILLCEDYALTREILVTGLKKTGHQVIDFESADQALKLTPDAITTIDVLLTDVEMPGTNGIELAWRLRRVSPELCVVVMSGSFIPYDQISNLDAIFLPKPFAFNDLIGAIEACPTARRENPLHQLA